jgi:hypothetical protein
MLLKVIPQNEEQIHRPYPAQQQMRENTLIKKSDFSYFHSLNIVNCLEVLINFKNMNMKFKMFLIMFLLLERLKV